MVFMQKTVVINETNWSDALWVQQIIDWIAGHARGLQMQICTHDDGNQDILYTDPRTGTLTTWSPTTIWDQGGPIIEEEKIKTWYDPDTNLWNAGSVNDEYKIKANTLLIAAMQVYCFQSIKRVGYSGIEIPTILWLPNTEES